ncbi:MAG: TPM domain-containing protein, partial [Hymenobacter sp.]
MRLAKHLASWPVLTLLWLTLALTGHAQDVPPRPNPPRLVNDLAHVMQPQEADALEQKLVAYDDSTSSQIAVVTVPSLGGSDIFSYAQKLYQTWGIGRKGKDNGLLILVAIQEHQVRTQTGYGLEGAVPDALAKRIGDQIMAPAFKQNQYYTGLDRGTDALIALAKGEYKADPADAQRRGRGRDNSGSGTFFWI